MSAIESRRGFLKKFVGGAAAALGIGGIGVASFEIFKMGMEARKVLFDKIFSSPSKDLYLDRMGLNNREAFEKRMRELEGEISAIESLDTSKFFDLRKTLNWGFEMISKNNDVGTGLHYIESVINEVNEVKKLVELLKFTCPDADALEDKMKYAPLSDKEKNKITELGFNKKLLKEADYKFNRLIINILEAKTSTNPLRLHPIAMAFFELPKDKLWIFKNNWSGVQAGLRIQDFAKKLMEEILK